MNKFEEHPYKTNFGVIKAAFNALEKEQKDQGMTLIGYKGVTKEAYEQLEFERLRIKEVRSLVNVLLEEYYKNNTIK